MVSKEGKVKVGSYLNALKDLKDEVSTSESKDDETSTMPEVNTSKSKEVSKTGSKKSGKKVGSSALTTEAEPVATMSIKVNESFRDHWMLEARRRKTTVSRLVKDFLTQELGRPDDV